MTIPLLPDGTPDYEEIARQDDQNMIDRGLVPKSRGNQFLGVSDGIEMSTPMGRPRRPRRRLTIDNDALVYMAVGAAFMIAVFFLILIGVELWGG